MSIKKKYKISKKFGFLPDYEPITSFNSKELKPLEIITKDFTQKVQSKRIFDEVNAFVELEIDNVNK